MIDDRIKNLAARVSHGDETALNELMRLEGRRRPVAPEVDEYKIDQCHECPWLRRPQLYDRHADYKCRHPDWDTLGPLLAMDPDLPPDHPPVTCPLRSKSLLLRLGAR